jgi:hypothetical protein
VVFPGDSVPGSGPALCVCVGGGGLPRARHGLSESSMIYCTVALTSGGVLTWAKTRPRNNNNNRFLWNKNDPSHAGCLSVKQEQAHNMLHGAPGHFVQDIK